MCSEVMQCYRVCRILLRGDTFGNSNLLPLLPVNIQINMISVAPILAYARESFKIGYSLCISGADGIKEQSLRSRHSTEVYVGF